MTKWTRRQLLLAGLGITGITTGSLELARRRSMELEQSQLSTQLLSDPEVVNRAVTNAIEGDREATSKVEQIRAALTLQPPTVRYSRSMSKILIQSSRLATEQYLTGKFDLSFGGSILGLPSYTENLDNYKQIASIKGPQTVDTEERISTASVSKRDPLLVRLNRLRDMIKGIAGRSLVIRWSYPVYWGFVLTGPNHHILVLRGTQRGHEWFETLRANQVSSSQVPEFDFPGLIHDGFATIYARLSNPVIEATRQLDPTKPLYIAGHSLGSPLATLAALDIAQRIPSFRNSIRLYSYAGPRLGNPSFAEAFSRVIPNSYRILNVADLVPTLPPTSIEDMIYVHVGQPWRFARSSGDIGSNHFISIYRDAISRELEQPLRNNGLCLS
jgi:predicted lipase